LTFFASKIADNRTMTIEGITISDMVKKLGLPRHTIENRLSRAGIKPVVPEFLYPPDTIDKIREAKRGRPAKKPKDQEPAPKPPKNPQAPPK
jgi:hypothetical protein